MEQKCTLTDQDLIEACESLVGNLAAGTEKWRMTVPVNFNKDSDMLLCEVIARFKDRTATPSPAKAEQEGQWHELKERIRGSGEWELSPAVNGPAWIPKGPDIQPVDDRRFYIWFPTTLPVKEVEPDDSLFKINDYARQQGITDEVLKILHKKAAVWNKDIYPHMLKGLLNGWCMGYRSGKESAPVKEAGQPDPGHLYALKTIAGVVQPETESGLVNFFITVKTLAAEALADTSQVKPAPSGLRWVKCTERYPGTNQRVIVRWHHNMGDQIFSDYFDGHTLKDWVDKNKPDIEHIDLEWLDESDSPAPVQVDPVAFALWIGNNRYHFWPEDQAWDVPSRLKLFNSRLSSAQLMALYTQSLQPKP